MDNLNRMTTHKKSIHGIGINDADYRVYRHEKGKCVWICPYYNKWRNMITRCYSDKYLAKFPTYTDCEVSDDWKYFMAFRSWMITQNWQGKHLDKDFLVHGNKLYSPETCVFIDPVTNSFIIGSGASRGELPIGVSWCRQYKKFRAMCSNPFTKKVDYLGCFNTPEEANEAWRKRKHELACQLAENQEDVRVADRLRTMYI